ncbi:hypothetical protein [Cupriavidus sp. BIC8F]|uniref:lipopolysaccharide biosynthesis protein n=1 Tax=Cupriavidus sp. BIC8F TaxID=3079014 RepID=UPI0029168EF0|nr:hypothetical protein [Cupriavidus sp. BIC8F]
MSGSMRRRVIAGSGANAFGQGVTVAIQLGSLPIFLHYWDAATYGVWLTLSAIPSYLSMADVGIVTTASNKMTAAIGNRDPVYAATIFQSALLFLAAVSSVLLIGAVVGALMLPMPAAYESTDYRLTVVFLAGTVLVTLFGGLADAIFKSTGRYPIGALLGNLVRLAEWLGAMLGLSLFGTFSAVAAGGLIARALGFICAAVIATRGAHGIIWSLKGASLREVRIMAKPAAAFMLFPLSFALSLQGLTLLVAHTLGPTAVAIFNTYRTLARISVQATSVVSHALWPEFARLYGAGDTLVASEIFRRSARIGVIFSVAIGCALYFASPILLKIWTHGRVEFQPVLMLAMALYSVAASVGHIPRTFLSATNLHHGLALWMVGAAAASLLMGALVSQTFGLVGISAAMLAAECAVTMMATRFSLKALQRLALV